MKHIVLVLLTLSCAKDSFAQDISAIRLPEIVETVCKAIIRQDLIALKGKSAEKPVIVDWTISPGIVKVNYPLLETPIAKKFNLLALEGFDVTQQQYIIAHANQYFREALQTRAVQNPLKAALAAKDDQDLCLEHWTAFNNQICKHISVFFQRDFPDSIVGETPAKTIEAHASSIGVWSNINELSKEENDIFMASQLAIAFSLRFMFEKNPVVFKKKFRRFLTSTHSAVRAESAGSSSDGNTFAASLEFWKQIERTTQDQTQSVAAQSSETECSNTQDEPINAQNSSSQETSHTPINVDPAALGIALWNAGVHSL